MVRCEAVANGVRIAGCAAVVLAGMLPWFAVETGARVSGYRLAELSLSLDSTLLPPPSLALVWYLMPAAAIVCGTLVHARATTRTRRAEVVLGALVVVLATGYLLYAAQATTGLQSGPVVALVGAVVAMVALLISAPDESAGFALSPRG